MIKPTYSIIIPVFNEEEVLPSLFPRLEALVSRLDASCEVLLIDDGSRDRSPEIITKALASFPWLRFIRFARNFGHQAALSAGYDFAQGDAVVCMDADLQDPPEVVVEMAQRWREGFQVIYGVRNARAGETLFKKFTAWSYYRTMRSLARIDMPVDAGDFRLLDRNAVDALRSIRERNRYLRGLVAWIGFKQCSVKYDRAGRAAGETKYPLRKMLALAFDGILSFSSVPLRTALILGFVVSGLSFITGIAALVVKIGGWYTVDGWTSLAVLVCFIGGVHLTVMGLIGEYISRIYDEVKARPLYIVAENRGGP
ncbi:MAG TPA: glycosyltransferase [Planctomycetes bacterium]|nr:glycosyltransferase [Planctomycetota bacterium]